jgi:hypothetical protein
MWASIKKATLRVAFFCGRYAGVAKRIHEIRLIRGLVGGAAFVIVPGLEGYQGLIAQELLHGDTALG